MTSSPVCIALASLCLPPPPRFAPPDLGPRAAEAYLRRAAALHLLGAGAGLCDTSRRTGLDVHTLRGLAARAVSRTPAGGYRGYDACRPARQGHDRRRRVHPAPPLRRPVPPFPPMTTPERRRWHGLLLDLLQAGVVEVHWPPPAAPEVPHA